MALRRTITHWTAGGSRANDVDKKHYHFITEWDGEIIKGKQEPEDNIVTSDGDYAAHVLNLNRGSIGVAMAGMHGAVESPFDPGPAPITEKQFEHHCMLLAELHRKYAIPVTRETCLTHAEVQPTLGVVQRGKWDLTRLPFKLDLRGALPVGDYMRERVKTYMQASGVEVLPAARASLLHEGMAYSAEVELWQHELAALGYFPGKIDGYFGARTKAATMAFQADHGLDIDGVAGPQTRSALLTKATPQPERDVSMDELRDKSKTVAEAEKGKASAGVGGAIAGASVIAAQAQEVVGIVQQAEGVMDAAKGIAPTILILLAVAGAAWLAWRQFNRIEARRLADARSGANLRI